MFDGLNRAGLADFAALDVMIRIVTWLSENFKIDIAHIESGFSIYESLLPLAAENEPKPGYVDQVSELGTLFVQRAVTLGPRYPQQAAEIVEKALKHLKAHKDDIRDATRILCTRV